MKIILSAEEIERWIAIYESTNPIGPKRIWINDLLMVINVCIQACIMYRFEIAHSGEEQPPYKTIDELIESVLIVLVEKNNDEGSGEESKDYEEVYRLLLDDILTCFYIFTGNVDLSITLNEDALKNSRVQFDIDKEIFSIDITPRGTALCLC